MVHVGKGNELYIVGMQHDRVMCLPLMEATRETRAVKGCLLSGNYETAAGSRGPGFRGMLDVLEMMSMPMEIHRRHTATPGERPPHVAVIHAGGLAPGMDPAAKIAVRLDLDRGFTMLGAVGRFPGPLDGELCELTWADVNSQAGSGGAHLGTHRSVPIINQYYALGWEIEKNQIDALMITGGFTGYLAVLHITEEKNCYPAFDLSIICVPTSINNNLSSAELSIGVDTAPNNNTEVIDCTKQSVAASHRCFVARAMRR